MRKLFTSALILTIWAPMAEAQLPPVPQPTVADGGPQPRLFVLQRRLDLGPVIEGDTKRATWILENRGNADLIITSTRSSCGCTVVRLTEEEMTIKPGGSLNLEADFNSTGRKNQLTKSITVNTNDPTEPTIKLSFNVTVEALYELTPSKLINLRSVRRGQEASQTIDLLPAPNHRAVDLISVELPDGDPIRFTDEPLSSRNGRGIRIRLTVEESAAVGALTSNIRIKFRVDGLEREQVLPIRGQVVGDLTWTPRVVDATRKVSPPGYRLAPVTIEASNDVPFEILRASADPYCDVTFEAAPAGKKGVSKYTLMLTLRDSAETGPFGTTLDIRTNLLDQPVIHVPVYGNIATPIDIDPPVVLLRQDSTPAGTQRRIKFQVLPQVALDISSVVCQHDAIEAKIDEAAIGRYRHIRFLDVRLKKGAPIKERHAVITLTTNIAGAETIELPVTIEIPGDS